MAYPVQIVIACADPAGLAGFWTQVLGYVEQPPPDGFETWEEFADQVGIPEENRNDISAVVDPDGSGPRILFERYDGGAPNQRVHFDVNVIGSHAELTADERGTRLGAERARIEDLGGSFKREASGMAGEVWIEMYDPEGNWFCVQ